MKVFLAQETAALTAQSDIAPHDLATDAADMETVLTEFAPIKAYTSDGVGVATAAPVDFAEGRVETDGADIAASFAPAAMDMLATRDDSLMASASPEPAIAEVPADATKMSVAMTDFVPAAAQMTNGAADHTSNGAAPVEASASTIFTGWKQQPGCRAILRRKIRGVTWWGTKLSFNKAAQRGRVDAYTCVTSMG